MTLSADKVALHELGAQLATGGTRTDSDVTDSYSRDSTDLLNAGTPMAVVSPQDALEVSAVLTWASHHRVGVVTRGAATGISGGALVPDGCIVLSTEKLTTIREINPEDRLAIAEAGVLNGDLNRAVAEHGLMFAPDPSSSPTCSVGGNVATNTGGLRCVRYGATRAHVLGLEVVLPDGTVMHTGGRTVKRSTGYDLTQLFVGSEGTLGVVVSATVRLLPQPPPQLTALATFDAVEGAARAAARLTATGNPTLVELMDRSAVHAIDRYLNAGLDASVGGVLLVQADNVSGAGAWFEDSLAGSIDLTVTDDEFEANYLVDFRRAAYPAAQTLGKVLVEDVAVPVSRLPELIAAIEHVGGSHGIDILTVAHAGDGNAHPLMVVGSGVDAEEQIWMAADAIFRATQQLGGTISGEHGIGRLKRKWLSSEVGPEGVQLMHRIKSAFDPLGIMNPGSLLP